MLIDFFRKDTDAINYWDTNNQIKFDLAATQLEKYLEWKGNWRIKKDENGNDLSYKKLEGFLEELNKLKYREGIRWDGSIILYVYEEDSGISFSTSYKPEYVEKIYPGDIVYKKIQRTSTFKKTFFRYPTGVFYRWYHDFSLDKKQYLSLSTSHQNFTYQNLTESFRAPIKGNWVFFSELTTCKTFVDDNDMINQINNNNGKSFYDAGVRNNNLVFLREDDTKEDFGASIYKFIWSDSESIGKLEKVPDNEVNLLVEVWKENSLLNNLNDTSDNFILHIKATDIVHYNTNSIFLLPIDYFDVKWWIKVDNKWEPIQLDWTYSWCYCPRDKFDTQKDFYSKSGLFQPILKIIVKDYKSKNLNNLAIQIV